eukprot:tig00001477_g8895.t1
MGSAVSSRASVGPPRLPSRASSRSSSSSEDPDLESGLELGLRSRHAPLGARGAVHERPWRRREAAADRGHWAALRSAADLQELEREIAVRDLELEALRLRRRLSASAAALGPTPSPGPDASPRPRPAPPASATPSRTPPLESPRASPGDEADAESEAEAGAAAAGAAAEGAEIVAAGPRRPRGRPRRRPQPRRRSVPAGLAATVGPRAAMRWPRGASTRCCPAGPGPALAGQAAPPPSPYSPGKQAGVRAALAAARGGGFLLTDAARMARRHSDFGPTGGVVPVPPAAPRRASLPAAMPLAPAASPGPASQPVLTRGSAWGAPTSGMAALGEHAFGPSPSIAEVLAAARAEARRGEAGRGPAWSGASLERLDGLAAMQAPTIRAPRPGSTLFLPPPGAAGAGAAEAGRHLSPERAASPAGARGGGFGALGAAARLHWRPIPRLR